MIQLNIDYDKIRLDNIEEYGAGKRHLEFFNQFYPDRTHFVYELLQNAEDAGATQILFKLYPDKLEVMHDGRLFNEDDVRGICGIGLGTKKEDLTQIGKFGIGFKSVYAYTSSPEIHSGTEHFKIEYYVRPFKIEPQVIGERWTTLFVLRLDAKNLDVKKAFNDIGTRLTMLNANTLLFLKNLHTIAYQLTNQDKGIYQRKEETIGNVKQVTVVGKHNNERQEENWLIFKKPIHTTENLSSVRIEIAFQVKIDPTTNTLKISKVKESPLYVFFPTEKETRLGFLIQGPFRTTPARDNVPREDSWNNSLVNQAAVFITECLLKLKEMELLTVDTLMMLPIRADEFPRSNMFYPIYEAVKEAFINNNLLPTDDNSFSSARKVKLARGSELKRLLRRDQLSLLFYSNEDISWLPDGITQDRTPDLKKYLTREIGIDEITPEGFANRVTDSFFEKQTDEWLIEFYKYISSRKELWRSGREYGVTTGPLYNKRFIRLHDGSHVRPFSADGSPNAFISDEASTRTNHQVVKLEISNHEEVKRFLNELGIPDLDIVEEIIETFPIKYRNPVPVVEHKQDIEKIKKAWNTDSQEKKRRLKKILQELPFILVDIPGIDMPKFIKPSSAYFPSNDLADYFDGNNSIGFVGSEYDEDALGIFKDLGVSEKVKVKKRIRDPKGYILISNISGHYERGVDGFDPNIEIDGLNHALKNPSMTRSKYIWNNIVMPYVDCIFGTIERSTRKTFANAQVERSYSAFGQLLVDSNWLPKADVGFVQPKNLSLDDLPSVFVKSERLAEKLGMQKAIYKKLAEDLGVSLEDIDFLKRYSSEFVKWKESIINKNKLEVPEQEITNAASKKEKALAIDNSWQIDQISKPNVNLTSPSSMKTKSEHSSEQRSKSRYSLKRNSRNLSGTEFSEPGLTDAGLSHMNRSQDKDRMSPPRESTSKAHKVTGQRRLLSYVVPANRDNSIEDYDIENDSRRLNIGETAVKVVLEYENRNGRKARAMSHSNEGYDVISECDNGDKRYIEVKGTEGTWGERGVAMSRMQFFYTRENPNRSYWLYVVENVFSQTPIIHKIYNPIEQVDYYIFDGGWSQMAECVEEQASEIKIPSPGDRVLVNNNEVGVVESILKAGKFPLVIYRTPDGYERRKLLAEVTIIPKEEA